MTVLTTFAANSSAADARDTLNAMLTDITSLKGGSVAPITLSLSGAQSVAEGGAVTFTVTRTGDMSRDVFVDYATQGTGSNPVNAADHAGGAFPAGRITIAAGASTGTYVVASAQDSDVEPNETGLTTITSPTAGVTISSASAIYTFNNDDGSGSAVVYPVGSDPGSTNDTGLRNAGGPQRISGKMVPGFTMTFGTSSDGADGFKLVYLDGTGKYKAIDRVNGNDTDIGGYSYNDLTGASDTPTDFEITFDADGRTTFIYGGNTLINAVRLNGKTKTGTYARAQHASAQPTVITRIS